MIHVVIDTSIYRSDPKRVKPAFRALARLLRGKKVQLHIPYYVKKEFLSQQVTTIVGAITSIHNTANDILRAIRHSRVGSYAEQVKSEATTVLQDAAKCVEEEFEGWLTEHYAVEHSIKPDHAQRVTADYFKGAPPFKSAKNRLDFPDSFIWQTILDLAKDMMKLYVIANDGALYDAAAKDSRMIAFKTLDEFVQQPECQSALGALTDETVKINIERAKATISMHQQSLEDMIENGIIGALDDMTVHHSSIPDDNHEGLIYLVDAPLELSFDFNKIEYYGANELGVPFEAYVECTLNYAIFKADYYVLPDERAKQISITDRNEHYFDADEDYVVRTNGTLTLKLNLEQLETVDITDYDIAYMIEDAVYNVEVEDVSVASHYEKD